jgi:hypothetical protein
MDLTSRINHLMEQLDVAAMELTDARHPDITVHLNLNGLAPEAEEIVECAVTEAHETGEAISVTLTPVRSHCVACAQIFDLPADHLTPYCPQCAATHAVA